MLLGNFNDLGGRQIHQDDMRVLQEEMLKAIQLQYVGQGAFILQGCAVTGVAGNYTIGNGLVMINGKVMEFTSTTGIVSFPKYMVQAADIPQDSFPLEQGGSAYKRTLVKAELVDSVPGSGEFIVMSASGGRNYNDILATQFVRLSGNQNVNGQKNFTSDVISNGLNVNTEINNINSSLSGKANKVTTISATEGLSGGGDLSSNRVIGIANGGVTLGKLESSVQTRLVPSGTIVMWSGNPLALPTGWLLCDGTSGTPNLKGRFIVGYDGADVDYNSIGKVGGAKTVTLTTSQIPSHSHSMSSAGSHQHYVKEVVRGDEGSSGDDQTVGSYDEGGSNKYTNYAGDHTHTINSTGGGGAHENRPPYYALAYIMKQ